MVLVASTSVLQISIGRCIIMMTNLSHDETLKEAAELGAKESIIKSDVTPDKVLEKINHLLET